MSPRLSLSSLRSQCNEIAWQRQAWLGALPPDPRDLSLCGQNGRLREAARAASGHSGG